MVTAPAPDYFPHLVDLSGLPREVVEQVHRLVREARERQLRTGIPTPPHPTGPIPIFAVPPPNLTPEESERLLDEMAAMGSGQSLPLDWSRADLYEDHD